MTLRHMKILVEVYRQNSVTKAAQALHLSQPSVSLALRELEDYYGVTLFERVGRRISPTECGREFYGYAVHVVSLMDELETRMRNWDAIGTVRIGATVTIGTYLLPELVRQGLRPDVIVLDPPRKGADEAVLRAIAVAQPARVVYISCNPATQARDARILCAMGYAAQRCQPVDMFCQTAGVENVMLFERQQAAEQP